MVDLPSGSVYSGRWSGKLHGGGKEIAALLEITPKRGTLSLGDKGPETITGLCLQGSALVGKSIGKIESADTTRNHATSLSVKLQLRDNKLAGRILATATGAGELAVLPYIIELGPSN
jgi:hypothetical protein